MSVVINTNSAATVAANNLAASNTALQKSLNRLSSGSKIVAPSDDAGGLAVSMKLSAAARRQGAVETNIANATSLLQTQDGVLSVTAKILNRISELRVLNNDVTKSSSDKANYNSEFKALQAQITANGSEKFNGVALFGSTDHSVGVTEDGKTAVTAKGTNLLGATSVPLVPQFTETFADLSNWDESSGAGSSASVSGGVLTLTGVGVGAAEISTKVTYSAPFQVNMKVKFPSSGGQLFMNVAGQDMPVLNQGTEITDNAWHDVRVTFDAAGNSSTYLDGSSTAVASNVGDGHAEPGEFHLFQWHAGETAIKGFSISNITGGSGTPSNVGLVANATDLSSLSLDTISSAIEDTATYRAQNGATQSRLGFASELVTVNKANLEAATSRITDVDVAQESTALARNNVLVSAGTSMLAQANQSSQMALKLLS